MWPFTHPPTTLTCPYPLDSTSPQVQFYIPPKRSLHHPILPFLHTPYLGSDQSTCSTKLPNAGVAYEILSLKRNG